MLTVNLQLKISKAVLCEGQHVSIIISNKGLPSLSVLLLDDERKHNNSINGLTLSGISNL